MTDERYLLLAVLGLTAGFASSFLGIGGGLVIVPVLMIFCHYPMKTAVGTSLAAIVLISLIGVLVEAMVKWPNIHWGMGAILTVGSLLGSFMGGKVLARVPEGPLRIVYTGFLILAAYRMFASASAADGHGVLSLTDAPVVGGALAIVTGILAGLSSVFFGIGGGIIMVPSLSLLFNEFPFHAARATSLVTIIPTSAFGAWQHNRIGTVDLSAAKRLVPAGLVGSVLGVLTVNHLPARPCRLIFAAFLVVAAARLLWPMVASRRPAA
jgi:uncharacterized membrane protein YfcA